jgi:hypothetical protein
LKIESKADKKTTSNVKPNGAQNTPQKVTKKADEEVSNLLLSSCLGIFTHLLRDAPQNGFLQLSADKLSHMLRSCFKRAADENAEPLRSALKTFMVLLYSQDSTPKLQGLCRHSLEEMIIATVDSDKSLADAERTDSRSTANRYDAILFGLQLVDAVVRVNPKFLQSFTSTLITVTEKLAKQLTAGSMKSRNAAKSSYASASPLETVFETACTHGKTSYSMKASKSQNPSTERGLQPSNSKTDKDCFLSCLRFLGMGDVPFYFTDDRRKLFTILSDILDSSTDIRILLTVIAQLGKWLSTGHKQTPLTRKETKYFLKKLTTLESRGLPEIESQSLHYLISIITLHFQTSPDCTAWMEKDGADSSEPTPPGQHSGDDALDTLSQILNRISVGSLMSTNTSDDISALCVYA